uniref:Uncharacterized protein n=1 Tax=Romanomermis culicivorax TaxID=13658 RepID=A0A915JJR1_ROMCU
MILFGGYVIGFYTMMYLINTFVSNVPESVIMKRQRRAHLVAKMFETDWQTSRASFDNRDTTIKHEHQQGACHTQTCEHYDDPLACSCTVRNRFRIKSRTNFVPFTAIVVETSWKG